MGSKELLYVDLSAVHPEVTGSCHPEFVRLPNGRTFRFAVDCGLFQERQYNDLNKHLPFRAEDMEFVLVTHNHVDHTGRLPLLVKEGFRGNIYASPDTCTLMPLALADSQKVLRDNARKNNERLLYNEADVLKTESLLTPLEFYSSRKISENVKVTLLKNGHLIGAAMILVQITYPRHDSINLLFTGDYNNKNMFFDLPNIPKWILQLPLTVIMESTYGYMESTSVKKVFRENVLECLYDGGSVIVPVFSLGRSQEILYEIKCMQDVGALKRNVPIYLDGKLAIKYTGLYLKKGELQIKPSMRNFLPDNLTFVNNLNRANVLDDMGEKIVLTTAGMGSYGPAQTYIPRYITRKNALIQFSGYTAEDTLGGRLKNAEEGEDVLVGGLIAKKRAKVEYTTEYSAHAKADEMIQFLKRFKNLNFVLINHGQDEVKLQFAKRVANEVRPKDVGILGGEYSYRVSQSGLVKTLSSTCG